MAKGVCAGNDGVLLSLANDDNTYLRKVKLDIRIYYIKHSDECICRYPRNTQQPLTTYNHRTDLHLVCQRLVSSACTVI